MHSIEIIVVAYKFSRHNLKHLKKMFPEVKVIISNKVRGFSENNNLGLEHASGKYSLILNDDTVMVSNLVEELVKTIEILPEDVAVVSPKILNPDKTIQWCGRPKYNISTLLLQEMNLLKLYENKSKYTYKNGVFQTYNIVGACFLIKTGIFKKINLFNEYYFFSPEDIAVSTKLNREGYKCYVNSYVELIHYGGSTSTLSSIQKATKPAAVKGIIEFYADDNKLKFYIVLSIVLFFSLIKLALYTFLHFLFPSDNKFSLKRKIYSNIFKTCQTDLTPKEIFINLYTG